MSSKDHGKKNPGQFFQQKSGNKGKDANASKPQGKAQKPSTSQSEKKGNPKKPDNAQPQSQHKNKGKSQPKMHPKANLSQAGGSVQQTLSALHSGLSVVNQGLHLLNQISSISANFQNPDTAAYARQNSSSQTNQDKGFLKKSHQVSKETDAPAQLRVFSGRQESNTQNASSFKSPSNRGRGQFHKPMDIDSQLQNSGSGHFHKPMHLDSQPMQNSGRGQFNKHIRINSPVTHNSGRGQFHSQIRIGFQTSQNFGRGQFHRPRGFHPGQQNRFISPNFSNVRQHSPQPTSPAAGNPLYRLPTSKSTPAEVFFFKTSSSGIMEKSKDSSSLSTTPFEVNGTPSNVAPIYKFKKNAKPKKANSQTSLSSETQSTKAKPVNQQKANRRRRKKGLNPVLWQKKKKNEEVIPLFTFQSNPVKAEIEVKNRVDSEDEDNASLSRCSSDESIWTTNISDDEMDDFSDESEVTSEISVSSSMKGSEFSEDLPLISSIESGKISVFWDIENCPIPREKSAVDFVKLVRTMLYEGRTEANFCVVCDVHNLSSIHVDELHASNVTVFHMSSTNKNAADTKLNSLLFEFRDLYKDQRNCAIVLISGDSDFAHILNTLRFRHNIHINLICKSNARHSLIESAHKCIFYEDFIKKLPIRSKADDTEYLITVSNFPQDIAQKKIKAFLSTRLKSVNCRVKNINKKSADIISADECARERALALLKGFSIDDNEVQVTCSERRKASSTKASKGLKEKPGKLSPEGEKAKFDEEMHKGNVPGTKGAKDNVPSSKAAKDDIPGSRGAKDDVPGSKGEKNNVLGSKGANDDVPGSKGAKDDVPGSKGAVICVYVSVKLGDQIHWKQELEKLWSNSEFTLQWEGKISEGYFLANFKSLSQARKAQRILQQSQKNNPTSPKFLKLIKQDDLLSDLNLGNSIHDINGKKINEHIQIIESKKEVCLNKHKLLVADQKASSTPSVPGAREALAAKLEELNEQKIVFLNYTQNALDKVRSIDLESETLDQTLSDILRDYSRECNCLTTALPIYARKNAIIKRVKKHQVVVIRAETGSGKSTQITQYVWRERDLSQKGLIICTQPRKIAAISLAKHVSMQLGFGLGDVVGYQVGSTNKRSANTAILYVTDFAMLKMIVNENMDDVACIIVDEAHERTVYTDLLLGMIKNHLKTRPALKLIITSATIDTAIFKDYFGIGDEAVMEVAGRTFPIEDVWLDQDVYLGWDYFKKSIDTVLTILHQESGDILSFLTTPLETEKAVKTLTEKLDVKLAQSIKVLQLHGKLDVQEQQKIFDRTPNNMRKVVFATNCAETSVTIPGIKFVVDCGMVKESQYDSIKKMNVMSVNFVSQSSAEQRRGRAGRTQVGKCYRLYSKKNYESMIKGTAPEILRVNLGLALLKLMKLGVNDPLQFDFVQSPPQDVLRLSMQQLLDLNAVNLFDMSLSELGERMSYLPLEPRLSFMVLTGIDLGIGYEAIVLTALVTVSRNIFFRTAENKSEADVKKMRFCQSESDFLTYFEVYKEWATVPKQSRSNWCKLNCINARSLRNVQDLVNEIVHIIQNELKMKIATKFSENSVTDSILQLVFRSFYQNLCIFSGHYRLGYRSTSVSGDLLIHPSSSLYTYGRTRPEFLVYDTILKTDQTYLINVSPVSKDMILDCMHTFGLSIHLAGLEALPLTSYGISPIGKTILLHDIVGKHGIQRKQLENQLKNAIGSEDMIVDVDVEKGEVKVCGPKDKYEEIASILCPLIEKAQERLLKEEKEVFIYRELCAIVSAGITVRDVVVSGEFRDIKVILKSDIEIKSVVEQLQTCGQICTVREWKNYFKITFFSPVAAKLALETFGNEDTFVLQKIVNSNIYHGKINQYKVYVSCLRRECTGEAYITTEPPINVLSVSSLCYRDKLLKPSVCKKTSDLRLFGIPYDTDYYDFEKYVKSNIPADVKFVKCVIVRKKVYNSSSEEIEVMKQRLRKLFLEFSNKDKLSIHLKKPSDKDVRWTAFVFFENPCDGETAVTILKNRMFIDGVLGLQLNPSLQTNLYCKREVFTAIEEQISEALKFFKENCTPGNTLEINALPKGEVNVQIKITSNNVSDISDARKTILNLLLGDQIECSGNAVLEKLFSKFGHEHLKKLSEANPNCYIESNIHKKMLTIFGSVSACNSLKMEINEFVDQLSKENFEEIVLMPENGRPGVLRALLSKYGYDLEELKQICGLTSIEINSRQHILMVRGSSTAVTSCQDIIKDLKTKLGDTVYEEDTEFCPVCLDKVSNQFHRLEFCGHPYCKECILVWFQTASDFPLCCITCESAVVLEDIQWATKEVKSFDTEIFKKALAAFVESRSDVSYCPSPDCPMVFRKSSDGSVFECPECNNSICTQCQELYHYGISCSLNKLCKGDDDYSLKMWMEEDPDGRKTCPSCNSPIEKNGGCNHMTCWKCKCHMCWLCLKVFPTGYDVYNHQPNCPKLLSSTMNLIDL